MGKFTDAVDTGFGGFVGGAPGMILDAGMGLILGKSNDRRQLRQQQKLQDMQIKGQQQMMDYSMASQLKMWHDTNYSAQMEELKKAGLNEGLVYGMKGGGGTTTGAASGSVNGASAPTGGGEIQAMMGMGIQRAQLGLLEAQKANIEADTANKQADTQNKPLVGENLQANTLNLGQELKNKQAQEAMTRVQTRVLGLDAQLRGLTLDTMAERAEWETGKAIEEYKEIARTNFIGQATQNAEIKRIIQESVKAYLTNGLLKAQTANTQQATAESKARVDKMANDILAGWEGWAQEGQRIDIEKAKTDIQRKLQEWETQGSRAWMEVLKNGVGGIINKASGIIK